MGLITKIFGTYSDRELKSIWPIVHQIEGLEEEYKALTDAQLQAKTPEFKERLANGETLDDILPSRQWQLPVTHWSAPKKLSFMAYILSKKFTVSVKLSAMIGVVIFDTLYHLFPP